MAEGRPIHTAELVTSLRAFIRKALDLAPIPEDLRIPSQGPTRQQGGGKGDKGGGDKGGGGGGGSMGGSGMGGGGTGMGGRDPDET